MVPRAHLRALWALAEARGPLGMFRWLRQAHAPRGRQAGWQALLLQPDHVRGQLDAMRFAGPYESR